MAQEPPPVVDVVDVAGWAPLEFTFATGAVSPTTGAAPHEADASPGNPWLDWRFDLSLVAPDGRVVNVPGFFAGAGTGVEAGPSRGDTWCVRFTPPASDLGVWSGQARLRYGAQINVDAPDSAGGETLFVAPVSFRVVPPAENAPGFHGRGPVRASGDGRLRDGRGELFIKSGVGGPENLLGYAGFHGAIDGLDGGPPGETGGAPDFLHSFAAHTADWRAGDPDWTDAGGATGAGHGLIGALNRVAELGANALYVATMNLGGDGRDTFPFVTNGGGGQVPNDDAHVLSYSVRRLAQWNMVLEHAQRQGLYTQLVLAEREPTNIAWLGSAMGVRRRLYLKQLVAHFGHHPALEWTLCEENAAPGAATFAQFTPAELADMAAWIRSWDVDRHPRSVHVDPNDLGLFDAMIDQGHAGWLDCASLQVNGDTAATQHLYGSLSEECAALFLTRTGRRIVAHVDEPGDYRYGVGSELHQAAWGAVPSAGSDDRRRRVLYDALLSSAGVAWYFGAWDTTDGGGDLTLESFETRAQLIGQTRIARELLAATFRGETNLRPRDSLWTSDHGSGPLHPEYGSAEVLASGGGAAIVYLPTLEHGGVPTLGRIGRLDVVAHAGSRPGEMVAQWIEPSTGARIGAPVPFDPTLSFRPQLPVTLQGAPVAALDSDWLLVLR